MLHGEDKDHFLTWWGRERGGEKERGTGKGWGGRGRENERGGKTVRETEREESPR